MKKALFLTVIFMLLSGCFPASWKFSRNLETAELNGVNFVTYEQLEAIAQSNQADDSIFFIKLKTTELSGTPIVEYGGASGLVFDKDPSKILEYRNFIVIDMVESEKDNVGITAFGVPVTYHAVNRKGHGILPVNQEILYNSQFFQLLTHSAWNIASKNKLLFYAVAKVKIAKNSHGKTIEKNVFYDSTPRIDRRFSVNSMFDVVIVHVEKVYFVDKATNNILWVLTAQ